MHDAQRRICRWGRHLGDRESPTTEPDSADRSGGETSLIQVMWVWGLGSGHKNASYLRELLLDLPSEIGL
jgi:hypothetical protein